MDELAARREKFSKLTDDQRPIALLRGRGLSEKEVAAELNITVSTVKYHMKNIAPQLGLRHLNRTERAQELRKYAEAVTEVSEQAFTENDTEEKESDPSEAEEFLKPAHQRSTFGNAKFLAALILLLIVVIGFSATLNKKPTAPENITHEITQFTTQLPSSTLTASSIESVAPHKTPLNASKPTKLIATPKTVTSHCGEQEVFEYPVSPTFLRDQGVSVYTVENSTNAILNNFVRTISIGEQGIWLGYFSTDSNKQSGVSFSNKQEWIPCNFIDSVTNQNINDIAIDANGRIWVASEDAGVSVFDGNNWKKYGTPNGLPSEKTYSLTSSANGFIWLATWEGVAMYDGTEWSLPYTVNNHTLHNNHVDAIEFDDTGDIWVGHINAGISHFENKTGEWLHYTSQNSELSGNQVRDILVQPSQDGLGSSVWIATADGGISKYKNGSWENYGITEGLPSNDVRSLTTDAFDRVWAATAGGVVYWNTAEWIIYHTLPALDVAVGLKCENCPLDSDQIWTATETHGLTHSRIPLPDDVLDVIEIRYPKDVSPGETFRPEIVVSPRAPFQLREDRGDFLSNIDDNDMLLFGAWPLIPVKGTVQAGEPFTFTDYDRLFRAPELNEGETEKSFTSRWRVWMHTRYVGPPIEITFTVRQKANTE